VTGELFVVATPIGNLGDITFRAVETLKSVSLVACEDTRRTQKLLHYLGISKPFLRYDEHVHHRASAEIIDRLRGGADIALVTDAGTPTISDPGTRLVQDVVKEGFRVTPIPGPSSPIAVLSASGFGGNGFIFLGFLPRKEGPAKSLLQEALGLGRTVVVMESPFRVHKTLGLISKMGPELQVVVGRELTKLNEEFIRGRAAEVAERLTGRTIKGEVTIAFSKETKASQNKGAEDN